MHWNIMNDKQFWSIKFSKLKYRREDQKFRLSAEYVAPQNLGPPSLIWEISKIWGNYSWITPNALKSNEWQRIWVQTFCIIGSPQKLGPPSLICRNFKLWQTVFWIIQNALESNEWRRIWVLESFKSEIRKEGPDNSDFLQNLFSPETRSPSLICRNLKTVRKVLVNHLQSIEIYLKTKILGP